MHVDIWSTEVSQGIGKRVVAVKMYGYEGSNPNTNGEVGEAKMDQDSAEEMAKKADLQTVEKREKEISW